MTHEATVFLSERIVVRPVDDATEVVPLVHAAELNTIAQPDRYPSGQVDVVCNQQRLSAAKPDNEALMTRAVVIVRQQAHDATRIFDPAISVGLAITLLNTRLTLRSMAPS